MAIEKLGLISADDKAKLDYIDVTKLVYNTSVGNAKNNIPLNNGILNISLNSQMLNGYTSNDLKHGKQTGFSIKSTYIGKWIRIAEIRSNAYLACNFSISKSWIGSTASGVTFTMTGYTTFHTSQANSVLIQQTGYAGEIFKKVRVVWGGGDDTPIYLELFADTTLKTSDYILIGCDQANATVGREIVTLYSNPTVTNTIPSGLTTTEYKFFKNDFLTLKYGEEITDIDTPIHLARTTVIDLSSLGSGYWSTLKLYPPELNWQPGINYKVYIVIGDIKTGSLADPLNIELYEENYSTVPVKTINNVGFGLYIMEIVPIAYNKIWANIY